MTDQYRIEIEEMTGSTNSTVENQNSVNLAPWAQRLTTRIKDECNKWTIRSIPNPSPNAVSNQKPSIFKISNEGGEELYRDRTMVLGPYNHHKSHQFQGLLFSETEKRDAVMLAAKACQLNLSKFLCWISANINKVRACYAEGSFQMDDEEFAEMLLFDGFFIICVIMVLTQGPVYPSLWKKQIKDIKDEAIRNQCNRYILKSNQEARKVISDLLMLENQIPLDVVEYLWDDCYESGIWDGISFKDVALSCFDDFYPRGIESRDTSKLDCQHLLDLFHWSRMPIDRFKDRAIHSQPSLYISTVTELQASSVSFKKRTSGSFLDFNFSQRYFRTKGVISIPEIHLYGYSRRIIHNLDAFEQAYGLRSYGFTAYVDCMAQLVQTEKDVSILRSSGIIASTPMTDREVVAFYRTIRDGVQVEEIPTDLYELYEQVKNHIDNRPRFPNIWIPFGVLSISILVLSFLQTIYSMISYYVR